MAPRPSTTVASYEAMRKWPTDLHALRTFLLANIPAKITIPHLAMPADPTLNDADDRLWNIVGTLSSYLPVPPRLRAALFRVLAGIPGADLVRDATDPAGRHGMAVARTHKTGDRPIGVVRDEFIFTTTAYRYLGNSTVTAAPAGRIPIGSQLGSQALISTTTTDHLPDWAPAPGQCPQPVSVRR